ncbi:MAG: outer membrane porin GjpA [Mycolicibacter algericus]|uniref:outer membrane porin GjpA n=1 Tax=Mycolicibacter algericus TaxID=1288388 RepID=UPI003C744998
MFYLTSVNKCDSRSNTAASKPLETLAEGGTSPKETAVQQTLRPYVTVGIAIVGSGLIAATPVASPVTGLQVSRDVAFTSGLGDLVGPWQDVFNATSENLTQLTNNFAIAPFVGFQQFLANQAGFWDTMLNDPSSIPTVMQEMQANLDALMTAYTLANASDETVQMVTWHTLSGTNDTSIPPVIGHDSLLLLLPLFMSEEQQETLGPIINFAASPMSGMLMGAIGPMVSPLVALMNSISDGDSFGQILASPLDGFLNGATLDLDFLIPVIADSGLLPLPDGVSITHLDIAFGGMFSAGSAAPIYEVPSDPTTFVPAAGGSILNSLGMGIDASGLGLPIPPLDIASHGVGPFGAWLGWSQAIGSVLGMNWWNGKGAPVPPATPPLAGVDFPTLPSDFFDDGGMADTGSAAAMDASDWLQDVVAALGG